ncbi:MAG: trigger factor family protein, partial [Patescibacteria group bacterium]
MNIIEKRLNETSIELIVDLERGDIEADLQKAAKHIGEHVNIAGFRPGQAPYDIVSRHIGGEAKIYEEALQNIVSRTLPKIIIEKKLDTVGRPEISILKMVPPFGVSYKAIISLMPKVELGDTSKIKVKANEVKHDITEVEKVINQLLEMRMAEAA